VFGKLAPKVLVRVVAALLAAQLVVLVLERPGPHRITVVAEFARAGLNIRAGDEVRVRDVPVGTIRSITIDRRDFSARYTLSVDAGAPVGADASARIVPKTVFGDKYVELSAAQPGGALIGNGAVIPRSRTSTVTEFQQVLDRFTPALQSIDPAQVGGTIAALSAGLGNGVTLGQTAAGFGAAFDEIAGRQQDVSRLLAHIPGTAQTFGNDAGDLSALAVNLGTLSQSLAAHAPQLAGFLSSNADLLTRAGDLLSTEAARLQAITANGFDVLSLVAAHPGSVRGFMAGQAASTVGLESAAHLNALWAAIPHLIFNFPTVLDKSSQPVNNGRTGPGPQISIHSPPPPNGTVDVSPITRLLAPLLAPVSGG
jgi:phospholipid/cholesterol/gamma-HCH transport system substrate-binding protein